MCSSISGAHETTTSCPPVRELTITTRGNHWSRIRVRHLRKRNRVGRSPVFRLVNQAVKLKKLCSSLIKSEFSDPWVSVSAVERPTLDVDFPSDLHWTTFWATRCQCLRKLSQASLHLALGHPPFLVCQPHLRTYKISSLWRQQPHCYF